VPLRELADRISQSDVCLGIFGNTNKTKRVIPNKVYDYAASRRPIITASTPAIKELFSENEIFLVEAANAQKIADAILSVKSNMLEAGLRAQRAYDKFLRYALPEVLGLELKKIIQNIV